MGTPFNLMRPFPGVMRATAVCCGEEEVGVSKSVLTSEDVYLKTGTGRIRYSQQSVQLQNHRRARGELQLAMPDEPDGQEVLLPSSVAQSMPTFCSSEVQKMCNQSSASLLLIGLSCLILCSQITNDCSN